MQQAEALSVTYSCNWSMTKVSQQLAEHKVVTTLKFCYSKVEIKIALVYCQMILNLKVII